MRNDTQQARRLVWLVPGKQLTAAPRTPPPASVSISIVIPTIDEAVSLRKTVRRLLGGQRLDLLGTDDTPAIYAWYSGLPLAGGTPDAVQLTRRIGRTGAGAVEAAFLEKGNNVSGRDRV